MQEHAKARQAYADYVALGPKRSLRKLQALYLARIQDGDKAGAPTTRLTTLGQWSAAFQWTPRIAAMADQDAAAAEDAEHDRGKRIRSSGYALDYERIDVLQQLADRMRVDLLSTGKRSRLWVRDLKVISVEGNARAQADATSDGGESSDTRGKASSGGVSAAKATRKHVTVLRFNAAEVEQFRATLDDIAKESGGRVARSPHTLRKEAAEIARRLGLSEEDVPAILEEAQRLANAGEA